MSQLMISTQIKKYRTIMNMSQEELAEKVYVTRQTVSNWENNKNYPDIHSLILLSSLFNISLDQLIKGDINIMKEEINSLELKKFSNYSIIFGLLMLLSVISLIPSFIFFDLYGLIIPAVLYASSMYFALRLEKYKKKHDIQTYKEIVAFSEGRRLDEIEKAQERGKRPYQHVFAALASAIIAFVIIAVSAWIFGSLS